jgi:glycosyltransferase involved in cell wall biosynthesis
MALPHNLESLVPDECRAHPNGATRLFREEVWHLGAAASVFCCAREEQWLLALHGVHADFLPYHPPGPVAEHCLAVRARRQSARPQRWLIMGSANYGPTYAGMAAVLEMLKSLPGGPRLPVDIAGFGSEALRPEIVGTEFRLHGAVDASVLARLLVEARAVLLHQTAGAGALTRIAEMLTAGVPVLANPIAARSVIGREGLHVYETAVELRDLLNRDLPVPPLPARPAAAERRLVAALDALVRRNSVGSVRGVS